MPIPTLISSLPGMEAMATGMMKSMCKKHGVASIGTLLDLAKESGVKLIACQMTMDLFGYKKEEIVDGVEVGGAASWLDIAADSQINLFI